MRINHRHGAMGCSALDGHCDRAHARLCLLLGQAPAARPGHVDTLEPPRSSQTHARRGRALRASAQKPTRDGIAENSPAPIAICRGMRCDRHDIPVRHANPVALPAPSPSGRVAPTEPASSGSIPACRQPDAPGSGGKIPIDQLPGTDTARDTPNHARADSSHPLGPALATRGHPAAPGCRCLEFVHKPRRASMSDRRSPSGLAVSASIATSFRSSFEPNIRIDGTLFRSIGFRQLEKDVTRWTVRRTCCPVGGSQP